MVGKNVIKLAEDQAAHVTVHTLTNSSILDLKEWTVDMASDHPLYTPIQVATTCCLVIGFVQCIMYVLRLGMISSLLSETLVSGFTTGAGIHVLVSQMKDLIGVRLTPVTGNFKLIQVIFDSIDITAVIYAIFICSHSITGRISNHYKIGRCKFSSCIDFNNDNYNHLFQ